MKEILAKAKNDATGKIKVISNTEEAAIDADVLYTDTWVSTGKEKEKDGRIEDLMLYQLNANIIKKAKKDCIVMHCLPAHRGEEITDDVVDGPRSIVFEQAANRLVVGQAILEACIGC